MKKKIWIWCESLLENATAGPKARLDVVRFLGNAEPLLYKHSDALYRKILYAALHFLLFPFKIRRSDILIAQYPLFLGQKWCISFYKKILKFDVIYIIHDLDSFRGMGARSEEVRLLNYGSYIISQTASMKSFLEEMGLNKEKIGVLDIFDYFVIDRGIVDDKGGAFSKEKNVVVAGNLSQSKAGYIYKLKSIDSVEFQLYGGGADVSFLTKDAENVEYLGKFSADKPPAFLASYGLVWDGSDIDKCSGSMGEYLKINAPHKTSLYLSMGLPVIVWKESAMSDFVEKNCIGFSVDSLEQLNSIEFNADKHRKNAIEFSNKIRSGFFIRKAVSEALNNIHF